MMSKRILLFLFILYLLTGCYSNQMSNYYSDDRNYTEINGIIEKIEYNENYKALYITINYDKQEYDKFEQYDGVFKINEANEKVIKENSFYEEINVGDKVIIITAPKAFGDGYFLPIVYVATDEKIYLDFEQGKENLLYYLDE